MYTYFIIGILLGIAFCVLIPNMAPAIRKLVDQIRKQRAQNKVEPKPKMEKNINTSKYILETY